MREGLMILLFVVKCFVMFFFLDVDRDVMFMCKVSINIVFGFVFI